MSNELPMQERSFFLQHALKDSIAGRRPEPVEVPVLAEQLPETIVSELKLLPSQPSEVDPQGLAPATPGAKLDKGKVDVLRGAIQYFPKALEAVAFVSYLGAKKYSWMGWKSVPDGIRRYGAALARHLVYDAFARDDGPGGLGPEVLHAAQVAWNSLARLELIIKEQEEKNG
jgi:Domain of unknown function (DUF5664)